MTELSSTTVLITGVTGFLGSRLARRLTDRGTRVIGLARPGSSMDQLNLAGALEAVTLEYLPAEPQAAGTIFSRYPIDAIVHLAAASRLPETPDGIVKMIEANIQLPSLLAAAARAAGVRHFVNAGTSWQTCSGTDYMPFNYYAATKQAAEDVIDYYFRSDASAITLRLFDVYGPLDTRSKIVDLILDAVLTGKTLDMSPGEQKIDLVHVGDACAAFEVALASLLRGGAPGHWRYAVSGGEPTQLRDVVRMIEGIAGRPARINWGGRPYRPNEIMNPLTRLPLLPGWQPAISLPDGLRQCIEAWPRNQ